MSSLPLRQARGENLAVQLALISSLDTLYGLNVIYFYGTLVEECQHSVLATRNIRAGGGHVRPTHTRRIEQNPKVFSSDIMPIQLMYFQYHGYTSSQIIISGGSVNLQLVY